MGAILTPMQPELRAFIVYERLPEGCIAFTCRDDRSQPLLRTGDVAVIDATDREPAAGDLFVIRWNDGSTDMVELWQRAVRAGSGPNREMIDTVCWFAAAYDRPRSYREAMERLQRGRMDWGMADGPYATVGRNAGVLHSKLVGRVVGILEPGFAEPLRLTGAA